MANFAKAQLLKYGWTEGKGLGKNENGITEALKPKLKFNTEGLGHKLEEIQWWESAFNNAAKNVKISSGNDEVSISVTDKNNKPSSVTTEPNLKGSQWRQDQYKNFRKTSMLQDEKIVMLKNTDEKEEKEKPANTIPLLTDDELFKACGGRTAHKGARHGLGLSGKLERIARQEQKLLGLVSNLSTKEITNNIISKNEDNVDKDELDNNANDILNGTDLSCNENNDFIKSKSTLKRERRKIRNLSHLLSTSCNIDESNSNSMVALNEKNSNLKRKRSKDRKTNSNTNITDGTILSTVTLEDQDMSLSTNPVFDKKNKKHKKHSKHNIVKDDSNSSLYDCETLHHNSTCTAPLKLKKKRSKSQENDEISTEVANGSTFRKMKHQKRKIIKLMEKMNFGTNSEDEHIKNEDNVSVVDVIKSENTFSSDEALRLNRRISKKKKNRLNKKNKKKVNLERSVSNVFSKKKSGNMIESLMSLDITDDVTAKLKGSQNVQNIQKIKEKTKIGKDCNTDI